MLVLIGQVAPVPLRWRGRLLMANLAKASFSATRSLTPRVITRRPRLKLINSLSFLDTQKGVSPHRAGIPPYKKRHKKAACAAFVCVVLFGQAFSFGLYGYWFFCLAFPLWLLGFDNRFRFGYRLDLLGFGVLGFWLWLGGLCLNIWLLATSGQHRHYH